MDPERPELNIHALETEVLALWKARRLPPSGGVLGPPTGPTVRQFEGSWTQGDFPALVAHRAVMADVDARYLALAGRRVSGTLRQGPAVGAPVPSTIPALLTALGVWTGGDGRSPWDSQDRTAQVQTIVGRLAWKEILVTRDESFRVCPTCGTLRSPERIVYDEEEGDTYLVRFPVKVDESTVHALVWVDAPWKLLGTSALLVNPNLPYVVAGYHRREDREMILTSASSLARLSSWIPESVLDVVQQRPGREFQGLAYTYPLRHEFPMGGDLSPPAGTLLGAVDVGDSGTGIVPLVPGHGPTDARIADRLGVTGWPLLTPKGRLDYTLMHKYAGLDLETANEFVVRDLSEAGALLARLRVKRGVPHCSVCGTPLLWAPARAWCLEPSRLPAERRATFSRLLPKEVLPGQAEVAPWPISEATPTDDPTAVGLLECARCDRLEAPGGTKECPCGGQRTLVPRKLLPSVGGALGAWARFDPFLEGDSAHLYVAHRRRVPSLVHHLAAMSGIEGPVADVSLTVVPTVASDDVPELVAQHGADAVRAAVVRSGLSESSGGRFTDQSRREADRIRRWWTLSRDVVSQCDPSMIAAFARPIGGFLGELEVEDRAIIARWERTRVLALAHYDHGAPGLVHRRVSRFIDNDLIEYTDLIRPRLAVAGTPPTKRAALRTLVHLLRGISEVMAPIVPFTSEAVHRSLAPERTSLFEQPLTGLDRSLLNDDLVAAWDRWRSVLRSVDRLRRSRGIARTTLLPAVVLVTAADDLGDRLRAEKDLLERLARATRVEVGSPRVQWTGRQRVLRPIESEIQKVYPTQASQIVHILQRMGPRRGATPTGEEELRVVVDGYPVRIFPAMVSYVETLPSRVVPVPWPLGEMYIELPASSDEGRPAMPPLSSDAYWLVRRIERRLRVAAPLEGVPPRVALVTVKDPLASELRTSAPAIAQYLGLGEVRVVEKVEEIIPAHAMTGRTRTGDRWWVHVPGLPGPHPRRKQRRSFTRLKRVASPAPEEAATEVDYADEKVVAREEAVRALGQELDEIVGIPLLGPAKVAGAWDQGLQSVDDLRRAPFETVAALPGFGGPVAEIVLSKVGGTVPARPHRPVSRRPVVTTAHRPATTPSIVAPPNAPALPPPAPARGDELSSTILTTPSTVLGEAPTSTPPPVPERPGPEPTPSSVPAEIPVSPSPDLTVAGGPTVEATGPEPTSAPPTSVTEIPPTIEPVVLPVAEPDSTVTAEIAPPPPTPETGVVEEGSADESAESPAPIAPTGPTEREPTEAVPLEVELPPANAGESPPVLESSASPPEVIAPAVPEPGTPAAVLPTVPAPLEAATAPPQTPEPGPPPVPETREPEPLPLPETPEPEPLPLPESPELEPLPMPETPELEPLPMPEPQREGTIAPPAPVVVSDAHDLQQGPANPPPIEPTPVAASIAEAETLPSAVGVSPAPPTPEELEARASPPMEALTEEPDLSSAPSEGAGPPEPEVESAAVQETAPSVSEPEVLAVPPAVEPAPSTPAVAEPGPSEATSPGPPPLGPAEPGLPSSTPSPTESSVVPPPSPLAATVAPSVLMAPPPVTPPVEPTPVLPPSTGVELAAGESLVGALGAFLDATAAGHHGVCVVRDSPERIRARVGSRPIEVYWLSNIGRGPSLRPADLEGLWSLLFRKLVDDHATAFFFEGVEYLVRIHGVDAVLTGLVEFDRMAREHDARVWIYLTPALMKPSDIDRFRSTFGPSTPSG
ncbi:MAG TPA: class I tRNA ligase family protein [Thermoplasmata archaeon]|nr:class I tRNA ligase family protein [Thermoplasmata archaeon]